MDITQALAETLRSEKAVRKVTLPAMAAAGIARASVMRKLDGKRETTTAELRGFAMALGTTAAALMAQAEDRLERASEPASQPASQPAHSQRNRRRQVAEGQPELPARPGDPVRYVLPQPAAPVSGTLSPEAFERMADEVIGSLPDPDRVKSRRRSG